MSIFFRKFTITLYVVILLTLSMGLILSYRTIFGLRVAVIQSGSMEPNIKTGSLIISHKPANEEYKVGDIVSFKSAGNTITHRISWIEQKNGIRFFTTKGDSNPVPDTLPAYRESIYGKVLGVIPYLGYVLNFMRSQTGFILTALLLFFGWVYLEIVWLVHKFKHFFRIRLSI